MNVVLTSPAWPPETCANGIVTYVGSLRDGLVELGVGVKVLTSRLEHPSNDSGVEPLAPARRMPLISQKRARRLSVRLFGQRALTAETASRIARSLDRMKTEFAPDLVEMEESFGTVQAVAKRTSIPFVVRLHGPWFLNGDALGVPKDEMYERRVALEGQAIARAQAITSPSRDLLDRVREHYDLSLPHAEVIPNPAPPVNPRLLWSLQDCDPNLIVYVGRFDRHKGGDLVIDAFAQVAARRPELRLAFIGPDRGVRTADGKHIDLAEYVHSRVRDASVRARIDPLGQLTPDEVNRWRQKARVVVVASRFEVFGMVVVEALAQGCPLVAAGAGGIPEIVRHGENGFVFERSNAEDLAHWLAKMIDDPELAARMGREGATSMPSRFGIGPIARQTKQYYERVLASG
jgi:glycosyltransferase involved in cell wall biosynthesis